jgi:hypothetical protein
MSDRKIESPFDDDGAALAQLADKIPMDVQEAFERWWGRPLETSDAFCPDDELVAYVAFAAGYRRRGEVSIPQLVTDQ